MFLGKKESIKLILMGIGEYVLTLLIFYAFTVALHEWFHLTAVQLLGGDGYITKTWFGGLMTFTERPAYPVITAFAGGIGVAFFFFLLFFLDWLDDKEQASALFPLATSQLAYGIAEGIFLFIVTPEQFYDIAQIALGIGWVIGIIPSIYWLMQTIEGHIKSLEAPTA